MEKNRRSGRNAPSVNPFIPMKRKQFDWPQLLADGVWEQVGEWHYYRKHVTTGNNQTVFLASGLWEVRTNGELNAVKSNLSDALIIAEWVS